VYLRHQEKRRNYRGLIWLLILIAGAFTVLVYGQQKGLPFIKRAATPTPGPAFTATEKIAEGDALLLEGKIQPAIEAYQKAAQLDPDNAIALARWGRLLAIRRKTKLALQKTTRAVQLAPNDVEVLASYAMTLDWNEQYGDGHQQCVAGD